jgi:hypothetical protein
MRVLLVLRRALVGYVAISPLNFHGGNVDIKASRYQTFWVADLICFLAFSFGRTVFVARR